MDKRFYTLFVLTNDASKARQFRIPIKLFKAASALAVVFSIVLVYVFFDYARLKASDAELSAIQKENMSQKLELQGFAAKIKELEGHFAKLNLFDKKLRIIANIDDPRPTGGSPDAQLMGMGGNTETAEDYFSTPGAKVGALVKQMSSDITELETRAKTQENSFTELQEELMRQSTMLAATPSIWPSKGWVTSGYGERTSPFTGFQGLHKGMDIANRVGTPVVSSAEGIVVRAGDDPGLGKVVIISHGMGLKTTYGHLSELMVRQGQKVTRGQRIASMGNTGRSTGPHLHYEVTQNGVSVNPSKYILD
ncbi:MAG: M23 family metallopeptidase [Deltaproteobacteria bacterium]